VVNKLRSVNFLLKADNLRRFRFVFARSISAFSNLLLAVFLAQVAGESVLVNTTFTLASAYIWSTVVRFGGSNWLVTEIAKFRSPQSLIDKTLIGKDLVATVIISICFLSVFSVVILSGLLELEVVTSKYVLLLLVFLFFVYPVLMYAASFCVGRGYVERAVIFDPGFLTLIVTLCLGAIHFSGGIISFEVVILLYVVNSFAILLAFPVAVGAADFNLIVHGFVCWRRAFDAYITRAWLFIESVLGLFTGWGLLFFAGVVLPSAEYSIFILAFRFVQPVSFVQQLLNIRYSYLYAGFVSRSDFYGLDSCVRRNRSVALLMGLSYMPLLFLALCVYKQFYSGDLVIFYVCLFLWLMQLLNVSLGPVNLLFNLMGRPIFNIASVFFLFLGFVVCVSLDVSSAVGFSILLLLSVVLQKIYLFFMYKKMVVTS
jgi:hypothetical protein